MGEGRRKDQGDDQPLTLGSTKRAQELVNYLEVRQGMLNAASEYSPPAANLVKNARWQKRCGAELDRDLCPTILERVAVICSGAIRAAHAASLCEAE